MDFIDHTMDYANGLSPSVALLLFAVYVLCGLLPVGLICYGLYFLLTLPMRRQERARIFIDLLEMGLKQGLSPAQAICSASSSHDYSLGVRFHVFAAQLEEDEQLGQKLPLSRALLKAPRLVSPKIRAMLECGEKLGDLGRVLPACHQVLQDGVSHVRGANNYLLLLVFAITPALFLCQATFAIRVLPKYEEVFASLLDFEALPPFSRTVFNLDAVIVALSLCLVLVLWAAGLAYIIGPRSGFFSRSRDRLSWRLPWRRKRLQRDFSTVLAICLDAGVSEEESVRMAAEATANDEIIRRGQRATQLLKEGVRLQDAIKVLDDEGEFQWRLSNAIARGKGFMRALAGWIAALDAKAFQLEQGAAQVTTTALVLFNGLLVGSVVLSIFLLLVKLINSALLW